MKTLTYLTLALLLMPLGEARADDADAPAPTSAPGADDPAADDPGSKKSDGTTPESVTTPPESAKPTVVAEGLDGADTAWMLVASALVLLMTAPGLALFYGGLVRKKNILGVMMQCIFLMGLMSVIWALYGYSLAFGPTVGGYQAKDESGELQFNDDGSPTMVGGWVGGLDHVCLNGVTPRLERAKHPETGEPLLDKDGEPVMNAVYPMSGSIPALLFMVFQGMFFIITPALICGAFAERMKFSTMCVFMVLWGTFVYCPLAHWVWGGGFFKRFEAMGLPEPLDFAGGLVVHLSSGISALLVAILIGKRLGFGQEPMPPHNLTYTTIGAALLWVGWFGFNAGSELAVDGVAVNAFVATHLAAAAGVLAWSACEWIQRGHPSILGACSGAVAGLVCITPACGTCTPMAGIILGLAAGIVCYVACTSIKNRFGYDDSLDAFGVHGVGGTLGAVLVGVFASKRVNASSSGLLEGNPQQLVSQLLSIGIGLVLSVIGTLIILKVLDATMGLRVSQEDELKGLDLSQHSEEGYIFL